MDERISGPSAWLGEDIRNSNEWRITLDSQVAEELAETARLALADETSPQDVNRHHFPIGQAAGLAHQVHDQLENGLGFMVLQGLPFDVLSYEQKVALTLGFSDHVGQVVPQNYDLQRVVDVRDEGIEYSHRSRGYRGNKQLPFHTDGAHLFSLTCLGVGADGGETIIVSGPAAYNQLLQEYPEALKVLRRGFYHHRRGQHAPGEAPLSGDRVPVFTFHQGLLHCCYNRNPIEWAEKEGVILTSEERAALDALDTILARETMQLRLNMQPGEIAFVNNFITLHSRTEYQDSAELCRHMLRVWMSDPKSQRAGISLLDLYVPAAHVLKS